MLANSRTIVTPDKELVLTSRGEELLSALTDFEKELHCAILAASPPKSFVILTRPNC